jgi:hypothetical protein
VDGGIDLDTAPELLRAGVVALVAGRSIFRAPEAAVRGIRLRCVALLTHPFSGCGNGTQRNECNAGNAGNATQRIREMVTSGHGK